MKNIIQSGGILPRIDFLKQHPAWRSQYQVFRETISRLELPPEATGLSISCGDGTWDYLALSGHPNLARMIATDVIPCPVSREDVRRLNTRADWSFLRVAPDSPLPLKDACCELVLHMDVIEHTRRPYLLLRENYRVLKPGGYLLCGTPNLFRPANILKLLLGRLTFPARLDDELLFPERLNPLVDTRGMVHVQEFNQYQLRMMLEETGFEVLSLTRCFFGLSFLKIKLRDFPSGELGGNLCQYLFVVARKAA